MGFVMDRIENQESSGDRLDRDTLWYNAQRTAGSFDKVDVLYREVERRLIERLDYIPHRPQRILDLGAGIGGAVPGLRARCPKAEITLLDWSPARVRRGMELNADKSLLYSLPFFRRWGGRSRLSGIVGDIVSLPFAKQTMDWVWSNLALQWQTDPTRALSEVARVLRVQQAGAGNKAVPGLLILSTLGPDTLCELRGACAKADRAVSGDSTVSPHSPHILRFMDMHDWGDALVKAGLVDPVMEMEKIQLTYTNMNTLLSDLRLSGASNVLAHRRRGLYPSAWMKAVYQAYEGYREGGMLPVTIEVVYGHAWRGVPRAKRIDAVQPVHFSPHLARSGRGGF